MQENCKIDLAYERHRTSAQDWQARALSCGGLVCGFPAAGAMVAPSGCQPLLQERQWSVSCSVQL